MGRPRHRPRLAWALFVSLLLNHSVLLPVAYMLMVGWERESPEQVMEVALVPQSLEEEEPRLPQKLLRPELRTPRARRKDNPPPERPRPEEKRKKKKEKKEEKKKELVRPPDPTMQLKMVEVNNPESETPPEHARYLSDKNRQVERETRARNTNLEREDPRPEPLSLPNLNREPEPGSKESAIAELERREDRIKKIEKMLEQHPLMTMRRKAQTPMEERPQLAQPDPNGELPAEQKRQRYSRAQKRSRLHLDHHSHDRIYGQEATRQRELARRSPSKTKGYHNKKWQRIRSSLENFIPEVQPGNQTALGTRAHPFALYIARAHRKIHKLWGFGFLVDLDNKPDRQPMNDMKLWTMVEMVLLPDGKVDKATIVRPSGILTFDVAALDTVFSASPYPPAPRAIRSSDGKVYLHWRFHRDQRQCGTFGVDPYILTKPPTGPIDGNLAEVGRGGAEPRRLRRLNRPHQHGHGHEHARGPRTMPEPQTAARAGRAAAQRRVVPRDPGAREAAGRFLAALRAGDTAAMAGVCGLPFLTGGRKVTSSHKELRRMFGDLVREVSGAKLSGPKLMTMMEARKKMGYLPAGADYGSEMLVGQVSLGKRSVILLLQRRSGRWRVVGLNR